MHRPTPGNAFFASAGARRLAWLCGLALVLAGLALNLRSVGFEFLNLRDDDYNITLNPHMGPLGMARIRWMFTDVAYARRYLPLGWLGFSATYGFSGLNPAGYHAVGVALYAANAALVYLVVLNALRLLGAPTTTAGLGEWQVGAAALAAGWWAFSPLRVETTAWASGNLYGQSTALLLAGVLAYLRSYLASGPRRAALLCLSAAGYCASLLTYPIGLGVPFLLIGLDWLRTRGQPSAFRGLLAEKAFFFVPLAAIFAVTLAARINSHGIFGQVPTLQEFPLAGRIAQSAYVATYFMWKPWLPLHLSPLYDTLFDFNPAGWPFVLCVAAVIAASAAALASCRSRPAIAVIWFGYLAIAAPVLGLTEKPHMASDRYGCILTVVSAAVIAAGLARLSTRVMRMGACALSLALLAFFCRLTGRQLDLWTDDRTQHAYVERRLTNPVLLADFTSRRLILDFMRGDEAASTRAVDDYLRANPTNPSYLRAASIFAERRRLGPGYASVKYLAVLQQALALQLAKAGELREAGDHFGEAIRLDERFYQAAYDRAQVLLGLGRCEEALGDFLWSDRWAPAGLNDFERRQFLGRLETVAAAQGMPRMAHAARSALSR